MRKQEFIFLFDQFEKSLKVCLVIMLICLFLTQIMLLSNEETHALVNKAIRYEGVFQEDGIEAKATLQR
jgi:hypothetical protein